MTDKAPCEFCGEPTKKRDGDDVPICKDCYKDAIENHLGDIVDE